MLQHTATGSVKGKIGTFIFTWFPTKDFSKISPITQVYGLCFDETGKMVIVDTSGKYTLPGGTPEKNETPEQTLIREVDEEADLDLKNIIPLGYQKVEQKENGKIMYQLRYFALIKKIKPQTIDPAIRKIPKRKFIEPKDFSKYCPWGKIGDEIIRVAVGEFKYILANINL